MDNKNEKKLEQEDFLEEKLFPIENDNKENEEKTPIEQMVELQEKVEEELEGQKELMFFKHMFFVYNNGKFQTFISFVIAMCLYFLRMLFNKTSTVLPLQMMLAFFAALGINSSISLMRCSFNKEIKLELRKLSKRLSIYLFFAIVCIFIMIALI